MSRTVRTDRRKHWSQIEAHWARRKTNRRHRQRERQALHDARTDDAAGVVFPKPEHTGGWITN